MEDNSLLLLLLFSSSLLLFSTTLIRSLLKVFLSLVYQSPTRVTKVTISEPSISSFLLLSLATFASFLDDGLLHDFLELPPLQLALWRVRLDDNNVTLLALVLLVVRVELLVLLDALAILGVSELTSHTNHDCLIHLRTHYLLARER